MPAARCGGMASGGEARGEAGLGIEPQHEVHVLHRGARGSLAEVVEHGGQHRLVVGGVAEDIEAQVVGAVEAFRSEERRVGKEGGSTFRSRWSPEHSKKKNRKQVDYR